MTKKRKLYSFAAAIFTAGALITVALGWPGAHAQTTVTMLALKFPCHLAGSVLSRGGDIRQDDDGGGIDQSAGDDPSKERHFTPGQPPLVRTEIAPFIDRARRSR